MSKEKIVRITTIPQSFKGLLQGQLHFMSKHGFEVIAISSPGVQLQELEKNESVRVIPISMSRRITPFTDLMGLWQLYLVFLKEKPLVVHTHTPKAGTLGMMAAYLAGVPIRLHTVAGLPLMEVTGSKRMLLDAVERLTYKCATRVYSNSKGLYNFILERQYTNSSKLKVLANGSSNGIDTSYFNKHNVSTEIVVNLKKELDIDINDFVFIYVGRLVKDKGIRELVSAFKYINIIYKNIKLLLVGSMEAELDPLPSETLDEIGLNDNIKAVGYQNDVRPYFALSDVLTFPSYREGFPNVVMQAGAMGLLSIVSDINGCNEIIEHEVNGIIIPVKSEHNLRKAMIEVLENTELRDRLRKNARTMICERFERSKFWECLLGEYRTLLREYEK